MNDSEIERFFTAKDQIVEAKIRNRRALTNDEIAQIIKNNKVSFFSRRKLVKEGKCGLELEQLERAFSEQTNDLTQAEIDYIKVSYDHAMNKIFANYIFLCDDECTGPDRLLEEEAKIVPRVNRLLDFMKDRGIYGERQIRDQKSNDDRESYVESQKAKAAEEKGSSIRHS